MKTENKQLLKRIAISIIGISLMTYLAILNCIEWDSYVWVFSDKSSVKAFQYLANGAWSIFSIMFPIATLISAFISVARCVDAKN